MDLHDCCEEYAEGCVSCTLHQTLREDERKRIAALIAAEGPWCSECRSHEYAMSLAREGSKAETVYVINPEAVTEDSIVRTAYINITQDEIHPPVTTISVDCNLDVDEQGNVVGVEILQWPMSHSRKDDE